MSGIYHTLMVGAEGLFATRQGVDTAAHNIANAQVPGFSRQRLDIRPHDPQLVRGVVIGGGSYVESIKRLHDEFLEKQININNQSGGYFNAKLEGMKIMEPIFSPELSSNVNDEVTAFFSSIQDLALSPDDVTMRTNVRENANNLTDAFKRVDRSLKINRQDLNAKILGEVNDINSIVKTIAGLNVDIINMEASPGAMANDLRDQRDSELRKLTEKIRINYYEDQHGAFVVRGPGDIPLVERGLYGSLEGHVNSDNNGLVDVHIRDYEGYSSKNITKLMEGGRLHGLFEVRDVVAPQLLKQNNIMANTLITRINDVHRNGYGLKSYQETSGRNFFAPVEDLDRAAAEINLSEDIQTSLDAISVANTPMAPGDNILANELTRLRDEKMFNNGQSTLSEYYSNYISDFGLNINRITHLSEAQQISLADLQKQREGISGVSLDEEAINLMKWQTNFAAASKVIVAADEMLETVINLKR